MFPRLAARRTAAALTAALVAVLLVTFGGPSHAPVQRLSVSGAHHAATTAKAARVQHAASLNQQQQTPQHLDLATTPPRTTSDVRAPGASAAIGTAVVRTGSDLVAPTGRAPPAL